MIDRTEIRVGNWLQCSDGLYKVDNIWTEGINFGGDERGVHSFVPYENLEGIPLTDKWLTEFGFKDIASNGMSLRKEISDQDELCRYIDELEIRWQTQLSGFTRRFHIKYVHQLQNFYFSLTTQELTIK